MEMVMDKIRKIADARVQHMADEIIRKEGGYNDVKGDRGGATNKGVSLRYARGKGLMLDLNHDGVVDAKDIKLVTAEIAANLYIDDFYFKPGIDFLPPCLREQLFDIAVNGGAHRAISMIQSVLAKQFGAPCAVDGKNGMVTQRLAARVVASSGEKAVGNALVEARLAFYHQLVKDDPTQAKFERGWENRAESFRRD